MSHEMSSLSVITPGFVDLYYNDIHCLQITLKMMQLYQPISVELPHVLHNNPLCQVFLTLFQIWSKQPINSNLPVDFYFKQFLQYFPEAKGGLASGVFFSKSPRYLDIEFVASSLPFDNTIHQTLLRCNPEDPKIDLILLRIHRV